MGVMLPMTDARAAIEAVFQQEHGRVLAGLIAHFTGDFDLAEDALQDACVQALSAWRKDGVPSNPAAWLTTTAKRRAIDRLRKGGAHASTTVILDEALPAPEYDEPDAFDMMDDDADQAIPDERLKLIFTCCHPALTLEAQVALTLRTLGGLSTDAIARAFLVPVPTMAQRLARARNKIRDARIPYTVPPASQWVERLTGVLTVIYLIFNEGYSGRGDDAPAHDALCDEAIRLCRALVALLPNDVDSAEARGLLALLLLNDSRRTARVAAGRLVLLEHQDRSRWNQAQIDEGTTLLHEALSREAVGMYQLQAAISALHAEASKAANTDWAQIAALYGALAAMTGSPVVQVNRAVAVAMAHGAAAGLGLLLELDDAMADYFPYHAARADLLRRAGEREAAADAYARAVTLCQTALERAYLLSRLRELE